MCIDAKEAMTWWTADPLAIGVVTFASAIYLRGLRALWSTSGVGHGIRRWEAASFFGGQLSLLVALVSPIDRLSDLLFSAHMTQHEIIMLVAPPLVVLGRPWVALMWALPERARARLGKTLRSPLLVRSWRTATGPLLVVLVHALVVWLWHVPQLFEAAMRSEAVHAVQHACFFATAALFWWAILRGRYGRLGYGLAVGFVFATAMHTSVLGALITVAGGLWYPIYTARGAPWQLDALEDQALAGLIMWVPAGVLLTLVALALFAAWLGEAGRRVRLAERERRRAT
jgi:cytochrome c oxidase assembly factor CtaG